MILDFARCGFGTVVYPRRLPRTMCLALAPKISNSTEHLRIQLDQLHSEAEITRAKANNARLRLLRLSEAAEKLQRQAAVSVQTGKENEARELLYQKQRVMQALEKSKSRIELLDELCTKLNQAVSVKESQLIGNVALDLEVGREDDASPIRIVSPKQEVAKDLNEDKVFQPSATDLGDNQVLKYSAESQANGSFNKELQDLQGSLSVGFWDEDETINSLRGISSYEDFLERLDQQLNKIEAELVTILNLATLVLDSKEKPKNSKVQQTVELLESIRGIRQRIGSVVQANAEIR